MVMNIQTFSRHGAASSGKICRQNVRNCRIVVECRGCNGLLKMSQAQLFIVDGEPIKFAMRECPEREELKALILGNGGVMVHCATPYNILLAPSGSIVINGQSVSSNYVRDCTGANKLLDCEKYRAKKKVSSDSSQDLNDFDIDEMEIDDRKKWRRKIKSSHGAYTVHEDQLIIDYISRGNRLKKWKGNAVWKEFKNSVDTRRSWQSLKERFKKTILKNWKSYNVPKSFRDYLLKNSPPDHAPQRWREMDRRQLKLYTTPVAKIAPIITIRDDTNADKSTQNNSDDPTISTIQITDVRSLAEFDNPTPDTTMCLPEIIVIDDIDESTEKVTKGPMLFESDDETPYDDTDEQPDDTCDENAICIDRFVQSLARRPITMRRRGRLHYNPNFTASAGPKYERSVQVFERH